MRFNLKAPFEPRGDQPEAITRLVEGLRRGDRFQTLLGVTGSGKTFTMASIIERVQQPALVISPNKALVAQLYREFRSFFPENRVELFISYYDYYQPEAYIPTKDLYIEKDADINDLLARMRISALKSVLTRKDVVVVASVSAIYASGDPRDFQELNISLEIGQRIPRNELALKLASIQYSRSEDISSGGVFHLRGDVVEIFPPYEDYGIRIYFFDDEIERIISFDPMNRKTLEEFDRIIIYPAKEFVTTEEKIKHAVKEIERDLELRAKELEKNGKYLEAQRLKQRTLYDLEMLTTLGYCSGIENYSRYFDGRKPGEPPYTILDYFDKSEMIVFLDESHITVPQIRAMYHGDHSRKKNLVEYGFRLPSAFDNRPLTFEEFLESVGQIIFVSATPGDYELSVSTQIVEQLIRPTGLIDPEVVVKPTQNQVDDFIEEVQKVIERGERALVTVLTKKAAEMFSAYLNELGIRAEYLHSELDTVERVEVLKKLREGSVDVVVGVNLLREGLDLPEVSLVAIMDADKEGFLRSETTLIQTIGRAARNINGKVLLYADRITNSMKRAIEETNRRRMKQLMYNIEHDIKPESIVKPLYENIFEEFADNEEKIEIAKNTYLDGILALKEDLEAEEYLALLEEEMWRASSELRYEDAAMLRDEMLRIKRETKKDNI
ncbi:MULTISPECIES: excinuclease ABC subunit UvrB [Kosmotoga]|uniref:UvrABC system protein B n=1 Tax=Kosmotoga olearia (strain ATCC BAA-1733 / DSM 21960 / TBF 19.5.1) TaxID=521045 RepID=UVRB_KOSOT|nr:MULTISPECIES: excinuclease ABC subunit UvrB [Kosmotoga]C5CFR8.1 RecName: Full=UvrABC system protein B; Short=Protein UvrB; AltName: Full=Excinuclease ABC subunit B [Kosmotoga olearia TBF 19.5.1]ACR80416.1 excinuclease ABC, B subunit [Kosmotoga olearia TBF 19.5.1]MDI3523388.1 excinuclease subunit [Kosmotoga sp.]MDK2952886.1 excinuclease subunit [Kosmotoga sp.]OAA19916.1 excinuclease ABC subunit B [Kosmotoga sp. DU53]